ncbi:MAG: hypothetical protein JWP02_3145 [Acidimicrobiales bacterium]|nr:hypothetical protein [Acidimicrobiales bacterium]
MTKISAHVVVTRGAWVHTDNVRIEEWGERRHDAVRARRSFVRHAERRGSLVVLCIAIWLVTGAGYFWPIWVIVFAVLSLGIRARRVYSTSYDDD